MQECFASRRKYHFSDPHPRVIQLVRLPPGPASKTVKSPSETPVIHGLLDIRILENAIQSTLAPNELSHRGRLCATATHSLLALLKGVRLIKSSNFKATIMSGTFFMDHVRAKFRKQERLAQQKASNINSESPNPSSNIKAESNGTTKHSMSNNKDIKPGSPHSSVSTTPNSNTSSISSHHSTNGGDVKPVNGHSGKQSEEIHSNNNKWSSMSPQSCNTALLVQQANKVLSSQPSHLQTHHHHAAAAAALSSPFSSLLGATGGAASYLLGDHLKPTTANHLF
ncbi:unnamed protein product [Phaedon cochleariae]|uniref:Uncharacterized protein n=1 Tax=Phaedon cochleariae TaxID=80249 RepID=A0A9P0DPA1_PHACE|nr:unnamed protein product [Phaedon cochleariae]